jgi:hypothetical protein
MKTDDKGLLGGALSNARPATQSNNGHSSEAGPQRASEKTGRDFLYQRRLESFRPFVTDDGVPGVNLRFDGDEMIAVRIESPLLDIFYRAISRLKENPKIKR